MTTEFCYILIMFGILLVTIALVMRFVILRNPGDTPEEVCWSTGDKSEDADCKYCDAWRECSRYDGGRDDETEGS